MAFAALASIGAGVTMPLMNVVFGELPMRMAIRGFVAYHVLGSLVGDFTRYFSYDGTVTQAQFEAGLNKNAYVGRLGDMCLVLTLSACTFLPSSLPSLASLISTRYVSLPPELLKPAAGSKVL